MIGCCRGQVLNPEKKNINFEEEWIIKQQKQKKNGPSKYRKKTTLSVLTQSVKTMTA